MLWNVIDTEMGTGFKGNNNYSRHIIIYKSSYVLNL